MPIMLYQLPNGKVVFLTIEEYLDLTDEDIQYLMALDFGEQDYVIKRFISCQPIDFANNSPTTQLTSSALRIAYNVGFVTKDFPGLSWQ